MKKNKLIFNVLIGSVLLFGTYSSNTVFAQDTKSTTATDVTINKFMSMDFNKMMNDSSSADMNKYFSMYTAKNGEFDAKYSANGTSINSKMNGSLGNYNTQKDALSTGNTSTSSELRQRFLDSSKASGNKISSQTSLKDSQYNSQTTQDKSKFNSGAESAQANANSAYQSGTAKNDASVKSNTPTVTSSLDMNTFNKLTNGKQLSAKTLSQLKDDALKDDTLGKENKKIDGINSDVTKSMEDLTKSMNAMHTEAKDSMDVYIGIDSVIKEDERIAKEKKIKAMSPLEKQILGIDTTVY